MPRYPIYVVSKGRWDRSLTSHALDELDVLHYVVVESQEAEAYRSTLPPTATVLILDPAYQRDYDTCDDLGNSKSKGPGPARNFVWDHAIASGSERHWVMDDNINGFVRLTHNRRLRVTTDRVLIAMEDFVDRYANVAMAGPNYRYFADQRQGRLPPFIVNTRIYSCNLILNAAPYRWRGRYNEDTDLSLRMLKDGWCTILFETFLANKITTQAMPGGNTAEFYAKEGTLPKSRMQVNLHPDVSRLTWKYGRWHHEVDYRPFRKNRLRLKSNVVIPSEPNEYGMIYQERRSGEWVTVRG